jgi:hypothetical protein
VADARLTCGQPPHRDTPAQARPKREDLTGQKPNSNSQSESTAAKYSNGTARDAAHAFEWGFVLAGRSGLQRSKSRSGAGLRAAEQEERVRYDSAQAAGRPAGSVPNLPISRPALASMPAALRRDWSCSGLHCVIAAGCWPVDEVSCEMGEAPATRRDCLDLFACRSLTCLLLTLSRRVPCPFPRG